MKTRKKMKMRIRSIKRREVNSMNLVQAAKICAEYTEVLYPVVRQLLDQYGIGVRVVNKIYEVDEDSKSIRGRLEVELTPLFREIRNLLFREIEPRLEIVEEKFESDVKYRLMRELEELDVIVEDIFVLTIPYIQGNRYYIEIIIHVDYK